MSVFYLDHNPPRAVGTMVCLPGVNSGPYVFDGALAPLGERWRLLRIFVPGSNGVPLFLPFSSKSYARHVWSVLEGLGIQHPVVVMGHSMGGFAAQEMARMKPEHVQKMILVSTCRGQPDMTADLAQLQGQVGKSFWSVAQDIDKDPEEGMKVFFGQRFVTNFPDLYGQFVYQRGEYLPNQTARLAHISAGGTFSSVGWVDRLEMPTLVVHGTDDVLVSPQSGRKLAQSLPNGRWLELYGVGHFPLLEHERFWLHVNEFLSGAPLGVAVPPQENRFWRGLKKFLFSHG